MKTQLPVKLMMAPSQANSNKIEYYKINKYDVFAFQVEACLVRNDFKSHQNTSHVVFIICILQVLGLLLNMNQILFSLVPVNSQSTSIVYSVTLKHTILAYETFCWKITLNQILPFPLSYKIENITDPNISKGKDPKPWKYLGTFPCFSGKSNLR